MNGIMKKRRVAYEKFKEMCRTREPAFDFGDGEIVHFQLTPNGFWEWGGATNTGLLVDGRISYDHDISFDSNLEMLYGHLCSL